MITPPDNSSLYKSAEGYQAVMAHYDAAFEKMGLPYETTYVETRHGVTHTTLTGKADGRPLLRLAGASVAMLRLARIGEYDSSHLQLPTLPPVDLAQAGAGAVR